MRYLLEWFEGRATFEIDQHEVYKVWVMCDGKANNNRLQQLAIYRLAPNLRQVNR